MAKPVISTVVCFDFVLSTEIFLCNKAGKEETETDHKLIASAPSALMIEAYNLNGNFHLCLANIFSLSINSKVSS